MLPEKRTPAEGDRGPGKCLTAKLDNSNSTIPEQIFKGPDSRAKIRRAIDAFNETLAVVNENGRCVVFRPVYDPFLRRRVIERISFHDLRRMFSNRVIALRKGGKTICKTVADWWLDSEHRRQFIGGVCFDPTLSAPPNYWNLWCGFAVEPEIGDWSLMKQHILDVICSGNETYYEYLMNWLARMFQHPELMAEVAVVLRGKKGSGKSVVGQSILSALGQHGLYIANARYLTGNFNAHLQDAVYLFADEAFFACDREHEGVLKALITEPFLLIEAKHRNPVQMRNLLHIMMASNNDWVVPASSDERRYFVLDVSSDRIGDSGYFGALFHQMENGGLAAMIFDLLARDISGFDHRAVPRTTALDDQKRLSMNGLQRWWYEVLDRGYVYRTDYESDSAAPWSEFVTTELLHRSYLQHAKENGRHSPESREELGKMMKAIYPQKRPSNSASSGERPQGYVVGPLSVARRVFCEFAKITIEWD